VAAIFDALFDATSSGADARWQTVTNNLQAIADLANNQPDVYVICDDTQFFQTNQNGDVVFTSPVDNKQYGVCTKLDPTLLDSSC
jgi:hypothetical protein